MDHGSALHFANPSPEAELAVCHPALALSDLVPVYIKKKGKHLEITNL